MINTIYLIFSIIQMVLLFNYLPYTTLGLIYKYKPFLKMAQIKNIIHICLCTSILLLCSIIGNDSFIVIFFNSIGLLAWVLLYLYKRKK
jgi:hypothetical protein